MRQVKRLTDRPAFQRESQAAQVPHHDSSGALLARIRSTSSFKAVRQQLPGVFAGIDDCNAERMLDIPHKPVARWLYSNPKLWPQKVPVQPALKMTPDPNKPRTDARSIIVVLATLLLLCVVGWFFYVRGVRPVDPPTQPFIPGTKK